MSGISTVRPAHRAGANATRILRAGCEMSFAFGFVLLVASSSALWLEPGAALRMLRTAMLRFGIPLLAASMALTALAVRRVARDTGAREAHRLRERLYFVATLVLTVLAPSALLGARTMLVLRPGSAVVHAVEAGAWFLAAWLMWGNLDDARKLADGEPVQSDEPCVPGRSMSSIR